MCYRMNADGHRTKTERLEATLRKLSDEADFEVVVETCYAAAVHRIALACDRRTRQHHDTHKGLAKYLDDRDLTDLAALFRQLELLRTSRYYGAQSDGKSAKEARRILAEIQAKLH